MLIFYKLPSNLLVFVISIPFTSFKLFMKSPLYNIFEFEIPFTKSINKLNKIIEEKKIKINHNQLKFNCLNEK